MRNSLIALLVIATVPAFGFQMFENAVRRDHDDRSELRPIVKVITRHSETSSGTCTGFFVKNRENKAYIATARHCARYQLTRACEEGRLTFKTAYSNAAGRCKKVIVEVSDLDMALVEAEFPSWNNVQRAVRFLQLSEQAPQLNTQLKMVGFPGDPERNGQFTVTENCWITDGRMVELSDYPIADQEANRTWRERRPPNPEVTALANQIRGRYAAFNNCSVYGGNSGGPIMIHGTSIALGMPTAYYPQAFTEQPQTRSTSMDTTAMFIESNRTDLERAGVIFAQPYQN